MTVFKRTTIRSAVDTGTDSDRTQVDKLFLERLMEDVAQGVFSDEDNAYPELSWDADRIAFAFGQGGDSEPDVFLQRVSRSQLEIKDGANRSLLDLSVRRLDGEGEVGMAVDGNQVMFIAAGGFGYKGAPPRTAIPANAVVLNASDFPISRSISSSRWKRDIEDVELDRASHVISNLRPITYRGVESGSDTYPGFIAEEVATHEETLITRDPDGDPDYVTYDRIPVFLVSVVQDLLNRVEALEDADSGVP